MAAQNHFDEHTFTASVWQEGEWFVAQALEIDVASQGSTVESALANLREALELHFEPPTPSSLPEVHRIRVKVGAA
ncbi:MAG: type II toxin-antitoxin system HicB family antitoxin [bacterium]|nr:type II toxin-antitoxin system HicB family antitoxin [bacterium]